MSPFARYSQARHPALREMLVQGRIQALEKTLALIDSQLASRPSPALEEKRRQVAELLEKARRAIP